MGFFGVGATGNATEEDVLSPYTFSNSQATGLTGTMINRVGSNTVITPTSTSIPVPQGYYGGAITDGMVLPGATGNATAEDVLSPYTFSSSQGTGLTGTMINRVGSNTVITPTNVNIPVPQGYYGGAITDGMVQSVYFAKTGLVVQVKYNSNLNISLPSGLINTSLTLVS